MHRERGNLPGAVAAKLSEQRLALRGVKALESFRDQIHFFQIMERSEFLDDALLPFGAGDSDAVEMLDGTLASARSFRSADSVRQMAGKGYVCLWASSARAKYASRGM